ncbi:MAG: hypothetical protein AABX37_01055 [Nanoarchaeota archaeon]
MKKLFPLLMVSLLAFVVLLISCTPDEGDVEEAEQDQSAALAGQAIASGQRCIRNPQSDADACNSGSVCRRKVSLKSGKLYGSATYCMAPLTDNRACDQAGDCRSNNCQNNRCVACVPSTEICDGRDNDCNQQVDEGFNLQTDRNNCGSCGNICRSNACNTGTCVPLDSDKEFTLTLANNYVIVRSGNYGDNVNWRFSVDGRPENQVLSARSDLAWANSLHRLRGGIYEVWLERDGRSVSHHVTYVPGTTPADVGIVPPDNAEPAAASLIYSLTLGSNREVARTGDVNASIEFDNPLSSLTWIIEEDGIIMLKRKAMDETSYAHPYQPGHRYRIWLDFAVDLSNNRVPNIVDHRVSNIIQIDG